jgi:hypothetical protein
MSVLRHKRTSDVSSPSWVHAPTRRPQGGHWRLAWACPWGCGASLSTGRWSIKLEPSIQTAIDHFIVRCLHVLGYGIGSAVGTLLPLTIGIVAIGVIGCALFLGYERLNARRAPLPDIGRVERFLRD